MTSKTGTGVGTALDGTDGPTEPRGFLGQMSVVTTIYVVAVLRMFALA